MADPDPFLANSTFGNNPAAKSPEGNQLLSVTSNPPLSYTVTTGSTTAINSNAIRKHMTIFNNGSATVFLAFGANAAVLNKGLALPANAGYEMSPAFFNLNTNQVNVISAAGGEVLSIQEDY